MCVDINLAIIYLIFIVFAGFCGGTGFERGLMRKGEHSQQVGTNINPGSGAEVNLANDLNLNDNRDIRTFNYLASIPYVDINY